MGNISGPLQKRLAQYGLTEQAEAARVCALAESVSAGEWGVVSYKDGILKIRAISNDQAYLIKINSEKVIAKINKAIGSPKIKKLVFKIGQNS